MEELTTTDEPFFDLALRMSKTHKDYFLDLYPPNEERLAEFAAQAQESLGETGGDRSWRPRHLRAVSRTVFCELIGTAGTDVYPYDQCALGP